ncbi:hypothetical protein D9758_006550 [Tetrapyrgos nigripes]|uniref:Gylcosyl hydrolase 115 C-terminal domain-containing protein n=1 Tax=Tetrapyrgos nigripes TaxID=182062 RepID=A0A8H5GKT3_9AGAR|nr:hypothetical protein D9758_006550 [Tetrapyrgos nigripes]
MLSSFALALGVFASLNQVNALGQTRCVDFNPSSSSFAVVQGGNAAPILLSDDEWPGVQRAASDFADDIERVTGIRPSITNASSTSTSSSSRPIIIGTLGKSSLIDQVVNATQLDVSSVQGAWEAFMGMEVENPLPGVDSAYVVIGADKRGTIFALYDLSEQFGVSPWYWWADVPVKKHSQLFISPDGCAHGSPTVQYRAFFINDEQPGLTNWALEKFTNGTGAPGDNSPFNRLFHTKLFELILRMKANYFWPAQWSSAFNVDDPENQPLADMFGVVMGTRQVTPFHEEPMLRSIPIEWQLLGKGEWNYTTNSDFIFQWWVNSTIRAKPYESIYTLGMRGDGDCMYQLFHHGTGTNMVNHAIVLHNMAPRWQLHTIHCHLQTMMVFAWPAYAMHGNLMINDALVSVPLGEGTNIALLEKIISDQREIISDVFNGTNVTTIPQVWTLYKEVQGFYEDGLPAPDDIALLWSDDNWGNIRRYPVPSERNRAGGSGVYYHVDYVGDPRDYKWVPSSQVPKMFEQLSLAIERNASRIWVLNVGDLKPLERETEFFLNYAYDSSKWNLTNLDSWIEAWAQREFGLDDEDTKTVVRLVANLTQFNARRKPELINGTTFSLVNYREADTVLNQWDTLLNTSTKLFDSLDNATQPAFYQLVHHPIIASANLNKLLITAGKNALRATQAFLSTNELGDLAQELFEKDFDFEEAYHSLLDGKWDHIMDQTHLGYVYWQQPMTNSLTGLARVQSRKTALPGIMRMTPEGSSGAWPGDNPNDCPAHFSCPDPTITLDNFDPIFNRFVDLGSGGPTSFTFTVSSNVSWLNLSATQGNLSPDHPEERVWISVADWDQLEEGDNTAHVTFAASAPPAPGLTLQMRNMSVGMTLIATKKVVSGNFSGFVEGAGAIAFEAAHTSRNNPVEGITWTEIPGLGRTLSGITPWPRSGADGANFSAGTGPSVEYDFFNFNTISDSGNITVITHVSPSLNANGEDRPLGFAVQVDDLPVQSSYFMPFAPPGQLPDVWLDFVANSIVPVNMTFEGVQPGAHTLKIFMIEPAVVVQRVIIDTGGLKPSYFGPPESMQV